MIPALLLSALSMTAPQPASEPVHECPRKDVHVQWINKNSIHVTATINCDVWFVVYKTEGPHYESAGRQIMYSWARGPGWLSLPLPPDSCYQLDVIGHRPPDILDVGQTLGTVYSHRNGGTCAPPEDSTTVPVTTIPETTSTSTPDSTTSSSTTVSPTTTVHQTTSTSSTPTTSRTLPKNTTTSIVRRELPFTGSYSGQMIALGTAFIFAGASALGLSFRRR